MHNPRLSPRDRFLRNVSLVLLVFTSAIGCGPQSLYFLVAPFVDDKVEPKCKLADPKKEITVVIASRFENLEVRPEIQPAEQELAEALATQLRARFKENKDKVKIVPPLKVRQQLTRTREWDADTLVGVGKRFDADYVIAVTLQDMSLFMGNSYNQLYQGRADLEVVVYDVNQPPLEAVLQRYPYRAEFPKARPIDTSGTNPAQFRDLFVRNMGAELARWFAAYPPEKKLDFGE